MAKYDSGKKAYRAGWEFSDKKKRENYQRERVEKRLEEEVRNRQYIKEKMKAYMDSGMTVREVVEFIVEEEKEFIDKNFGYYKNIGIKIEDVLANWIRRYIRTNKERER